MIVRPLQSSIDLDLLHRWLTEPANAKWISFDRPVSRLGLKLMVQRSTDVYWFFSSDESDDPIGMVALVELVPGQTATLLAVLGEKRHAKQRYTLRAVAEIVEYGFFTLGLESISSWVVEPNIATLRISEVIGLRPGGRRRRCHLMDGVLYDRILVDALRTDFIPLPPALRPRRVLTAAASDAAARASGR